MNRGLGSWLSSAPCLSGSRSLVALWAGGEVARQTLKMPLTIDEENGPVYVDIERLDLYEGKVDILWWSFQEKEDGGYEQVLVKDTRELPISLTVGYSGVVSPPTGFEPHQEGDVLTVQL